ncbi:MAG: glycosyl hydrolase, partial [Candidatus Marinimicrobia bacterium]|nr:glycosyl hydrolase [Candidatus Neomarinimicrobiota bacterium]
MTSAESLDTTVKDVMKWRNIGPFRGGRSLTAVGSPNDPLTYYFGSVGGGIWKTTDGGIVWKNVSDGFLKTGSVGALAVAESDPNIIYAGMGEACIRPVMTSHGDGIYKSMDAGDTWSHIGLEKSRTISQ